MWRWGIVGCLCLFISDTPVAASCGDPDPNIFGLMWDSVLDFFVGKWDCRYEVGHYAVWALLMTGAVAWLSFSAGRAQAEDEMRSRSNRSF